MESTSEETVVVAQGTKRALEEDEDGFIMATSKRKLRKLRKMEKAKALGIDVDMAPSFVIKGNELKKFVSMGDIRDLLLWCLADGVNPSWVFVKNKLHLQRMVVVLVPFLDASILQHGYAPHPRLIPLEEVVREASARCEHQPHLPKGMFAHLPRVKDRFSHLCPVRGPSGTFQLQSPLHALLRCPWTKEETKRQKERAKKAAEDKQRPLTREDLVASMAELQQHEYPLPSAITGVPLEEHWLETSIRQHEHADDSEAALYAIDCEMVMTATGPQLARATLLDEQGEAVFDELVVQEQPVTDYLTDGMTAKKLQEARLTFKEVQKRLFDIINDSNAILVGHSLENDLKSLKLVHTRVIDTSIVYGHPSGLPFRWKLRMLASKYLDRQIQVTGKAENGEPIGHDSVEDALACLDLVKLKIAKGFEFGRNDKGTTSIFERLEQQTPPRLMTAR
ncbi:ribonuclease H-like domain-containing protein [Syncephalis pseudoplumigaleata]|uniref:Ribonuclease H-like domain-containing protein n=1 Tax=Syncephalis pseudoplumigaleata TaxID=1712513 RepID=A0A4P9Z438_9FUNG|nr:ribonuclease H-like domain-containing protein [Syncephalis pseudoplumigaleata]|eukprot:RKP27324.1 ribonuclease H-like domain-containing protein [Syncephalis pseudoplumigaleata]